MLNKLIMIFASLFFIGFFHAYMRTRLVYKHKKEVDQIVTYINKYISENYYKLPKHLQDDQEYNSIQVIAENDYCLRSDVFKYYHPEVILEDTYVTREVGGLIKKILKSSYYDAMPQLQLISKKQKVKSKYQIPLELSLPFNYYDQFLNKFQIGKSAQCLFWKNNHMNERHALSSKDRMLNNFYDYIDKMKASNLSQDCIVQLYLTQNNASYIPASYRLFKKDECKEFFKYVHTQEYKDKIAKDGPEFITKLGNEVHRGRGIDMVFPKELEKLISDYSNGTKCGQIPKLKVAQKYINNPYLYKNHKIEFRIYFILASTNPVIVYAHDRALIRRCAKPFNKFSLEKASHVCNTAIVKKTLSNEGITYGENEIEDEEFFIDWKLDQLQEILLKQGKIQDRNWLKNYLYPIVDRSIQHAVRSAMHKFPADSRLGEFFCADFLLTDDFKVYVLEINYNPQTLSTTPLRIKSHTKLVEDMIEILNAYNRNKYLRYKKIIEKIRLRMVRQRKSLEKAITPDILEEIRSAYVDKLDTIQLSDDNLFRKVMDLNNNGTIGYKGLIQDKCLK